MLVNKNKAVFMLAHSALMLTNTTSDFNSVLVNVKNLNVVKLV